MISATGRGFVVPTNPCLTVTFEGRAWWLQLSQPASESPYEAFRAWHEQEVGAAAIRQFVPRAHGLEWRDLRTPPGMPRACEARFGDTVLHLNGATPEVTVDEMQAQFLAFMGPDPGGRRLSTL